jgi:dinuclear metal center YbgI/SA1388 family protein
MYPVILPGIFPPGTILSHRGQHCCMHIHTVLEELEELAPQDLADPEDSGKIGLVVEGTDEIRNICCSVDVTMDVILQAAARDSTLIITHHTPFWNPLLTIRGHEAHLLRALLAADINLYVMHTNFDRAPHGVNRTLALLLDLKHVSEMPMGLLGECRLSLKTIRQRLNSSLKLYGNLERAHHLAVVGGSGFQTELIDYAFLHGADAFLSAELKHHVALHSPLPLLESTHYALEAPAMRRLAEDHDWLFMETALPCRDIR